MKSLWYQQSVTSVFYPDLQFHPGGGYCSHALTSALSERCSLQVCQPYFWDRSTSAMCWWYYQKFLSVLAQLVIFNITWISILISAYRQKSTNWKPTYHFEIEQDYFFVVCLFGNCPVQRWGTSRCSMPHLSWPPLFSVMGNLVSLHSLNQCVTVLILKNILSYVQCEYILIEFKPWSLALSLDSLLNDSSNVAL